MEVYLQVFGMVGLVETAIAFAYALLNRDEFTHFEAMFFLVYGSLEVASEALFLGLSSITQCAEEKCCNCMIDGGGDLVEGMKAWAKDVFHNAVARDAVYGVTDFAASSFSALLFSLLSVVLWATFCPVWGFSATNGAEDARMALSVASAAGVVLTLLMPLLFLRARRQDHFVNNTIYLVYGMEKVFVLYFLLSDAERLCAGSLGRAFAAFLILEISSICFVVVRALAGYL